MSWRHLFRLFFKNDPSKEFSAGLKSFKADGVQVVSVYQSYLLNIAFDQILDNYHSSSLTSAAPKLTDYVKKLKSVVEESEILNPKDIDDFTEFQNKINQDIQKERLNLVFSQNNVDVLSTRLSRLKESLNYLDKTVKSNRFEELYDVLQTELATFVKKNFDQAKGFYNKLSTENKQTIISEIASTQERLRAFELKQRDSQRNLKHLLSLKKEKLNNLPSSTRTDMIINEFISRPNNQISKEINERMKLISNDNIMNIQNEILKKKELVLQYRKFLDEYVKKIYGVEKNVIFSIE